MSAELLTQCKSYWDGLSYCGCYSDDIKAILSKATDCLYFEQSVPDGDAGAAVVETPDGYYAFEESQDYTGHGCQCGSVIGAAETGPFKSVEACVRYGLGVDTRRVLGVPLEDEV